MGGCAPVQCLGTLGKFPLPVSAVCFSLSICVSWFLLQVHDIAAIVQRVEELTASIRDLMIHVNDKTASELAAAMAKMAKLVDTELDILVALTNAPESAGLIDAVEVAKAEYKAMCREVEKVLRSE